MHFSTSVLFFASLASATYIVQDDYSPSRFASMFDFFTGPDPTSGYVDYVDQTTAQNGGLLKIQNNSIYMGVDNTNVVSGQGRESIRITSKNSYNHGLFMLDLAHMPGGQCGSWPAFWLLGPNWPNSGELDIIEGVNSQTTNSMALHTDSGCSITNQGQFSGELQYSNCDTSAPNQPSNVGCSITTKNSQNYGTGFNSAGGGVYATEWTSQYISIWFFPRSAIPKDITSGNPNPENWGLPMASFSGACNLDEHVFNQQIVFDITFCGSWAGQVWSQDTTCFAKASTCQDFVKNNPTAFKETYWQINSLKVYQNNGASNSSTSTTQGRTSTVPKSTSTTVATTISTIATTIASTTAMAPTTTPSTTPSTTISHAPSVTSSAAPSTIPSTTPPATSSTVPSTTSLIPAPTTFSTTYIVNTTPIATVTTVTASAPSWGNWGGQSGEGWGPQGHNGGQWSGYGGGPPNGRWGGGGRLRRT